MMRKLAIVTMTVTIIALLCGGILACSGTDEVSPNPTPTPASSPKKVSLSDASQLLDLSALIPASFEHVDAHSEGMSNEDIGLGPDFSEVEVFLRYEPYQLIYTFLLILESKIDKASADAVLKDDEQVRAILESGIAEGARQEGVEDLDLADFQISHPDIGNIATYGQGTLQAYGIFFGFDVCLFRRNDTYIYLYSIYYSEENLVSLEQIALELDGRLLQ
jgi:hypothetical protein